MARPFILGAVLAGFTLVAAPALALGPDTYAARKVEVPAFLGSIRMTVDPAATGITVSGTGDPAKLREVRVALNGDALRIERPLPREIIQQGDDKDDEPKLTLTVPRGTAVSLASFVGRFAANDGLSALSIRDRLAAEITVGDVGTVALQSNGAANIKLGDVSGPVSLDISGASSVRAGKVGGPLQVSIAGMGSVVVGRVESPVSLSIDGMGSIDIKGGRADPLNVAISGAGSVTFDGTAVNPSVRKSGLSSVSIGGKSY